MYEFLKNTYRAIKKLLGRFSYFTKVNWVKTLYFNFKKFPYQTAKKLPVFFYGSVSFQNISGEIIIDAPIQKGMIGFGKRFEKFTRSRGIAEISIEGKLVFKGVAMFGKDYFIHVGEGALLEIGNRSGMGKSGKIVCLEYVKLGDDVRISFESQVMDSNFHQLIDTNTLEKTAMSGPIVIGNNNFLGNRVSVLPNTATPDFCIVASNSLCNKDYTSLGQNILIGGTPAKLLREHISRDWEGEKGHAEIWNTL